MKAILTLDQKLSCIKDKNIPILHHRDMDFSVSSHDFAERYLLGSLREYGIMPIDLTGSTLDLSKWKGYIASLIELTGISYQHLKECICIIGVSDCVTAKLQDSLLDIEIKVYMDDLTSRGIL